MKHLIMGTAGHVDHGKTALIKALTDIECDTHPEEKKRGITINLGFSHFDMPNGDSLGIVDVPGHRDFVHTMVGGAAGIDFMLLVIAADSGVMPQTREHLQIMETLGVHHGLIALTKIDLVDQELLDMTLEDIRDLTAGTSFETAPIIKVSSVSMEGIGNLKKAIGETASTIEGKSTEGVFRMFIDRLFTVEGFGSVVTGSVISGSLSAEDHVCLLPGKSKSLRVRRIERHGQQVDDVRAGDRASINIVGMGKEDFTRGMIISKESFKETSIVDATVSLFDGASRLTLWSQVIFHIGTYEHQAKLHLIDCDDLKGGQTALAQVHLSVPCVVLHGDKFVIRNSSSDMSLGGGEIIDPHPLHHRRRPPKLIDKLSRISDGCLSEIIAAEVRKRYQILSAKEISAVIHVSTEDVIASLQERKPKDICVYDHQSEIIFLTKEDDKRLKKRVLVVVAQYHKNNPLDEKGIKFKELVTSCGLEDRSSGSLALNNIVACFRAQGELKNVDECWALTSYDPALAGKMEENINFVEKLLEEYGMQTPLMSEMVPAAQKKGMTEKEFKKILNYIVKEKKAYNIDGNYIQAKTVEACRQKLVDALKENNEGMKVAQFRDLVGGNRKMCLLLLSQYDSEGLTERQGEVRVLK